MFLFSKAYIQRVLTSIFLIVKVFVYYLTVFKNDENPAKKSIFVSWSAD